MLATHDKKAEPRAAASCAPAKVDHAKKLETKVK